MNNFWTNLRLFLWMVLLTGIIYPLAITVIAQITMNDNANGSMLISQGKTIGSSLLAQKFQSDKYFWPRPSTTDCNAIPSGGSNLGPTSIALKKAVEERKSQLAKANNVDPSQVPPELLFASGSGLDPHITPTAAYFQVDRIAKARDLDKKIVSDLIESHIERRQFGFFGSPRINVLELNIALDKGKQSK